MRLKARPWSAAGNTAARRPAAWKRAINHFLCPVAKSKYKDLLAVKSPDTLYRSRRVDSALRSRLGDITVDDMKSALFDDFGAPRAVCRPPVPSGLEENMTMTMTVAMIIMDLTDRIMWVCPAPHKNKEFTEYRLL